MEKVWDSSHNRDNIDWTNYCYILFWLTTVDNQMSCLLIHLVCSINFINADETYWKWPLIQIARRE
jgi:hypothetical protein